VTGVRCQVISGSPARSRHMASDFYAYSWLERQDVFIARRRPGRWLVLEHDQGLAARLAASLEAGGNQVVVSRAGVDGADPDAMDALVAKVLEEGSLQGVVYLSGAEDVVGEEGCVVVLHLVQALVRRSHELSARLAIVTTLAHRVSVEDGPSRPAGGSLWGLGRVVGSEHGELKSLLVDLPGEPGEEVIDELAGLLLSETTEDEVVLRSGRRWIHRLGIAPERPEAAPVMVDSTIPFSLEVASPGILDSLRYVEVAREPCSAREVEFEVVGVGLNFKDVMKAMNLLPVTYIENTYVGSGLGIECVGRVTRVGEEVKRFKVGDEVWATANDGGFRSYLKLDEDLIVPRVENLEWEESVTFTNHMTAFHGLHRLARLQAGERVLIHSATGGVGLAAVTVARWLGAEIFATAGTEEKRAYLREIGIEHVMDSRSLAFADQILAVTEGKGVDVVLNSLSGEGLRKSLEIVASYGRFIEIGRKDINDDAPLPMGAFERNVSFSAIDIDVMMADNETLFRQIYFEVRDLLADGSLEPLPTQVFPAAEVIDAFRLMARAQHIGKVVVRIDAGEVPVYRGHPRAGGIRDDGAYLITGGLGGFGLEVARWLVTRGARHLILVGRSGASTEQARSAVADFESAGVSVHVRSCDVADSNAVAELFEFIATLDVPLLGVFHSAMVLDDRILAHQDLSSFGCVMAPKARGGWLLHEATRSLSLDHFVMFSSISTLIGNAGQSNYVAANSFLDSLAHARRDQGLPAVSINWGVLKDVGVVARNPEVEAHLARMGIEGFTTFEALAALETILGLDHAQLGAAKISWQTWAGQGRSRGLSPRYERLVHIAGEEHGMALPAFVEELIEAQRASRPELMTALLVEILARVTRMSVDRIDVELSLDHMGVDSLAAVDLAGHLVASLQMDIPPVMLRQA
ncbi:MAG: SDR family NAD(P)-dependent oxidoreductase, partial [Bradymonadaceae bacterium]